MHGSERVGVRRCKGQASCCPAKPWCKHDSYTLSTSVASVVLCKQGQWRQDVTPSNLQNSALAAPHSKANRAPGGDGDPMSLNDRYQDAGSEFSRASEHPSTLLWARNAHALVCLPSPRIAGPTARLGRPRRGSARRWQEAFVEGARQRSWMCRATARSRSGSAQTIPSVPRLT